MADDDGGDAVVRWGWDVRPLTLVAAVVVMVHLSRCEAPDAHTVISVGLAAASVGVLVANGKRDWRGLLIVQVSGSVYCAISVANGWVQSGSYDDGLRSILAATAALMSVNLTVKRYGAPAEWHLSSPLLLVVALAAAWRAESYFAGVEAASLKLVALAQIGLFAWLTGRHRRQTNTLSMFVAWSLFALAVYGRAAGPAGAAGHRDEHMDVALYAVLLAQAISRKPVGRPQAQTDDLVEELHRARQEIHEQRCEIERLQTLSYAELERHCDEVVRAIKRIRSGRRAVPRLPDGMVLGKRYRIVRFVGAGGMGSVYEATRLVDHRRAAVKVLDGPIDLGSLARLAREAKIACQVDHPNVVSVFDVDVEASFLAMELVRGVSLEQERGRYEDIPWALTVLRQVAAGIAALHDKHIVHRDIKPANVLLSYPPQGGSPSVKIVDFGISTVTFETGEAPTEPRPAGVPLVGGVTTTGAILGTPLYLAPERAEGTGDPRPASDVYSFGVLAYELLSGRPPFRSPPVYLNLGAAGWTEPPALASLGLDLREPVAELVSRCLEIDPARRPTARELAAALDAAAREPPGDRARRGEGSPQGSHDATRRTWPSPDHEGSPR